MSAIVTDSTGQTLFNLDSCAKTYTYDGSGNPLTVTAVYGSSSFVKTYTYTGAQLTSESAWVKQ